MSIIAIDFDGTMVAHDYPNVGHDIGAVPVIKKLMAARHSIILFTMRTGDQLKDAVNWCDNHGIALYGINNNPTQAKWSSSPKVFANFYLDDAALGCPLVYDATTGRDHVDWAAMEALLKSKSLI